MKILGHPIHVMLIHFPTALLPADLILSFLFYRTGNISFGSAAFFCLIGGVGLGWLAAVTGLIDLALIRNNAPATNAAFLHGGINAVSLIAFSLFAYKGWKLYPAVQEPSALILGTKLFFVLFLLAGNYLGGRLIFKHHIGIESNE
jgi:uncharacterized membrane protein